MGGVGSNPTLSTTSSLKRAVRNFDRSLRKGTETISVKWNKILSGFGLLKVKRKAKVGELGSNPNIVA